MAATARRYLAFYVLTSLWWDLWRAGGNTVLILLLGRPLLRVLRRFERVLRFERNAVGAAVSAHPTDAVESLVSAPCQSARHG